MSDDALKAIFNIIYVLGVATGVLGVWAVSLLCALVLAIEDYAKERLVRRPSTAEPSTHAAEPDVQNGGSGVGREGEKPQ